MIIGIGIDLVEIREMEKGLQEEGFQSRVFTATEMDAVERFRNKSEHLGGKFATKEAFMKAIGVGLKQGMIFTQVEVLNDELGKPYLHLHGEAEKRFRESGAQHTHVSISHSGGLAIAVVILER